MVVTPDRGATGMLYRRRSETARRPPSNTRWPRSTSATCSTRTAASGAASHVAVVVVEDLALGSESPKLAAGGFDEGAPLVDDVPLRGGR